jgi:hypothetical protein
MNSQFSYEFKEFKSSSAKIIAIILQLKIMLSPKFLVINQTADECLNRESEARQPQPQRQATPPNEICIFENLGIEFSRVIANTTDGDPKITRGMLDLFEKYS